MVAMTTSTDSSRAAPLTVIELHVEAADALIKLQGKTRLGVARELGVSAGTIGDWFSGRRNPSAPLAYAFADALGVPFGAICTLKPFEPAVAVDGPVDGC
jgi:transcriptional regulator with XRE-family HTH domain